MKTILVIDGNSIINRAFFAIRGMNAPDGTPTNAVYGFLATLKKLLDERKPSGVCVCFDRPEPTFRHGLYDGYKATRKGMPDELAGQMPVLKSVLDAMGILRLELPGYEADDLIGAVCDKCAEAGYGAEVVTGDRDSFQLIGGGTGVLYVKTRGGLSETVAYDTETFTGEYGFGPEKLIDLKALMGDSSDNIPGVAGIGEKTATALVRDFGGVDDIYEKLSELPVKDAVRRKLEAGRDMAYLSRELAIIRRDAPIEFSVSDALWDFGGSLPGLRELFLRLGFKRFIESWGLSKPDAGGQLEIESFTPPPRCIETVAENGKRIGHNVKDIIRERGGEGAVGTDFAFDTALAAYLLDPTAGTYDINTLAVRYLGKPSGGEDALARLYPVLDGKLRELNMDSLMYDVELPLCAALADMELAGFAVDEAALREFGAELDESAARLERSIHTLAGGEFNIASPKQLGAVLFEKLMLPHGKRTKTGWSTSAEVLEELRDKHPIVGEILELRQLTKLKSTYVDGLLKVISPDGRIRTSFQMTATATGRLSSTEPNLQNIPVRTELGGRIRAKFAAAPGHVLVDADYSQIELRLLAHISGDTAMIDAFSSGEDIHAVTASQVFGVPLNSVTKEQRRSAKAVNFGIVYGISDFSLAKDLGISRIEAREYMESYLERFGGVRAYMRDIVAKAKELGYVETLYGRRRYLPELKSPNFNVRSFGERVALNMPVQGTAADIIKIAMVRVHRRLRNEGLAGRLILQVHDELIAECPEGEAERVAGILTGEMQDAAKLKVPLTAEAHSGKTWLDAK